MTNNTPSTATRDILKAIHDEAKHHIPHYAYGDNEAASDMATRLAVIEKLASSLLDTNTKEQGERSEREEVERLRQTIRGAFDFLYEYKRDDQNAKHAKLYLRNAIASFDGPELLFKREAQLEQQQPPTRIEQQANEAPERICIGFGPNVTTAYWHAGNIGREEVAYVRADLTAPQSNTQQAVPGGRIDADTKVRVFDALVKEFSGNAKHVGDKYAYRKASPFDPLYERSNFEEKIIVDTIPVYEWTLRCDGHSDIQGAFLKMVDAASPSASPGTNVGDKA
jgi:hypothetical protein